MDDVQKDILARFAALERLTAYLLASRLRSMAVDDSTAIKRSLSGHQLRAAGDIAEEAIDDISIMADEHVERIVAWASEMEQDWRASSNG